MKSSILALALTAAFAMPAFGQQVQNNQAPNRGAQRAAPLTMGTFIMEALQSDALEIQSGSIALERSRSPAIRSYAQKMVSDHGKTSAAMLGMGDTTASMGDVKTPMTMPLDSRRTAMILQLQSLEGPAFDQAFVEAQVMAHRDAVALFQGYARNGEDAATRAFARRTLPVLQTNLRDAQRLSDRTMSAR